MYKTQQTNYVQYVTVHAEDQQQQKQHMHSELIRIVENTDSERLRRVFKTFRPSTISPSIYLKLLAISVKIDDFL